jgi:hypothetical protein
MTPREARVADFRRRTQERIDAVLRGQPVDLKESLAELREFFEQDDGFAIETRVTRLVWLAYVGDRVDGELAIEARGQALALDPNASVDARLKRLEQKVQRRKRRAERVFTKRSAPR